MKNFNYNRCLQVIKWNIIANKKQIINGTIALAAVTVIVHCLNTGFLWSDDIIYYKISTTSNVLMTMGAIYMLLVAARINFNMQKKGDIINYAMLPATKLEKFCANWFMQVLLPLGMLFAGLFVGDVVQMIICILIHNDCYSIIIQMIGTSLPTFIVQHSPVLEALSAFLAVCIFHATFLYGGVFFRRHPVLLTIVCWIVIPMILGAIGVGLFTAFTYFKFYSNYDITVEWLVSQETLGVILSVVKLLVEVLILALLYWLTYRRFCRIQVINNRFYN